MMSAQGWASQNVIEVPSIDSVTFKVFALCFLALSALATNLHIYLYDSFRSPFLPRLDLGYR